ncbi:hypothetical protein DE146DRAFT_234510 [Phaeosphaeria sp. MPI-PUGE-AT-0046c]|nr:hypothetical protein DE146DRAFT_234510 [Phaeosphaeria sp. MPI-PUGE-AT-0046c]
MRNLIRDGFVLVATVVVLAAAHPPGYDAQPQQPFFLRANCPDEPWHGRYLVALPSSEQLGLENFTVHPETPPLKFVPLKVINGNYALQGEGGSDDLSDIPFLAALKSTTGTRTISMAMVYMSRPNRQSNNFYPNACPDGYECVTDQWAMDDPGADMVRAGFKFAGFDGKWEPFKDAGKEGWHMYWKGNAGLVHPLHLDLAPVQGSE